MTKNQPLSAVPPTHPLPSPFVVRVGASPSGAVIRLTGELDLEGAAVLTGCSGDLPRAGAVDIDLRAVSFLDTSGLGALVDLHDGLQRSRRTSARRAVGVPCANAAWAALVLPTGCSSSDMILRVPAQSCHQLAPAESRTAP